MTTTERTHHLRDSTLRSSRASRFGWSVGAAVLLLAPLLLACGGSDDDQLSALEGDELSSPDGYEQLARLEQPIVDGQVPAVNNAQRAATVALGYGSAGSYDYSCSGVLVGSRYLLTAMHCVANGTPSLVLFGDDARNPTATRVTVRSASVCGQHICNGVYSDLGIVEFDGGLPAGAAVAQLPSAERAVGIGTLLELWGYGGDGHGTDGIKRFGFNTVSGFGKYGQVDVVDVPESITVTACQGDSGGPAFFTSTGAQAIVAVTHGGANCATSSDHLEVRKHLSWIRAQLATSTRLDLTPHSFFTR